MNRLLFEKYINILTEAKEFTEKNPYYKPIINKFLTDLGGDNSFNRSLITKTINKYNELARLNIEIKVFNCEGKKLTFKDFRDITYSCFESTVDSIYSSKVDKEKTTDIVGDYKDLKNELFYSDDRYEIYKGDTKDKCINYVNLLGKEKDRKYSFCITWEKDNKFLEYRVTTKETIYFVYDKTLPITNPNHLLVVGVRPDDTYMVTDANNNSSTEIVNVKKEKVLSNFPTLSPIIDKLKADELSEQELEMYNKVNKVIEKPELFNTLNKEERLLYVQLATYIKDDIFKELSKEEQHIFIYNKGLIDSLDYIKTESDKILAILNAINGNDVNLIERLMNKDEYFKYLVDIFQNKQDELIVTYSFNKILRETPFEKKINLITPSLINLFLTVYELPEYELIKLLEYYKDKPEYMERINFKRLLSSNNKLLANKDIIRILFSTDYVFYNIYINEIMDEYIKKYYDTLNYSIITYLINEKSIQVLNRSNLKLLYDVVDFYNKNLKPKVIELYKKYDLIDENSSIRSLSNESYNKFKQLIRNL